jgi:hypothetical protein
MRAATRSRHPKARNSQSVQDGGPPPPHPPRNQAIGDRFAEEERMNAESLVQSGTRSVPVPKKMLWVGRVVGALLVLLLFLDGVGKLVELAPVVAGTVRLGYPENGVPWIGVVELACTIAYVIPRTSILGAILLTGFLGGATATHVRIGEPFFFPVAVGVLLWGALFLRDGRLRAFAR